MGRSRLDGSLSPFLQHGATQPVDWWPWSEEAFAEAAASDRPILLDIGAVWCHWCHVMDAESYEDAETAALINELFVPIKVDRDERPDIDARYQRAVQVLTRQGGWPLTAFLTPAGEVFYGGTYFPPADAHGRPSFRRVLREIARIWREDPARARSSTEAIRSSLEDYARVEAEAGAPDARMITSAVEDLARAFDARYGGFGQAPRFPNPGALDLLLDYAIDHDDDDARGIVARVLTAMGKGGITDQLGGGFHRYSTDVRWLVPHFEKMAGDNGPLLATCARACSVLREPLFRDVGIGVIEHYADVAPDLIEAGGFPASQDADVGFDNDGDYWTWTEDELRDVLGEGIEYQAARLHFGLDDEGGAMHLDRSRHVLFLALEAAGVAARLGIDPDEAAGAIARARALLKAARDARPAPFVDRTLFSGAVALVASGHLAAARFFASGDARRRALRALDRVWREGWTGHGLLHRLGDPRSVLLLEDQAQAGVAFTEAWELTQDPVWLDRARSLADVLATRFLLPGSGAFNDRAGPPDASAAVLDRPLMPITDAPTPSGNGSAALLLARLAAITGVPQYRDLADGVLRAFAGSAARLSGSAATWLHALAWATLPVTAVVVVEAPDGAGLFEAALATYRPRTLVRRLPPGAVPGPDAPAELRAMVTGDAPRAYVCAGHTCAAPVADPAALERVLREFRAAT